MTLETTFSTVEARLARTRLVPVVVIQDEDQAEPLAEALLAAGLDVIEITLRTRVALQAMARIAQRFPRMLLGAGTVLSASQAEEAKASGAHFGVAPGLSEEVVRQAQRIGLPFVPGVATPTELEHALRLDCRLLKFFPAEASGGIPMLKSLAAAYGHTDVRFIPTGGITPDTLPQWLGIPEVLAVGGSWMVEGALLQTRDWGTVQRRTAEALACTQVQGVRP